MKWILFLALFLVQSLAAEDQSAGEMLANAVRRGDLKTIDHLIASGVPADLPDPFGQTPLYLALTFRNSDAVQLLLSRHADPNGRVSVTRREIHSPTTPLQCAARSGDVRAAALLIAAGARVNVPGAAARAPLHFAGAQLDMVRLLIEKGADVNARDAELASPLDDAVWNGSVDTTAILLAHGARLNEANPRTGATPLNEAAFRGQTAVVRYLLVLRPDLTIPDNRGYRPTDNAIRMGKEDAAVLLLEAQAEDRPSRQDLDKWMNWAISSDESLVVEGLLHRGVSANDLVASGATLLDAAASTGKTKVAAVLLAHGADPDASGQIGTTPLEDAALRGFDAVAALLLDHGAQVNQVNARSGTTALYAAAAFGKAGVVKLLLERGANAGTCGANRKSAYQAAAANGYREVAGLIQQHGGAIECQNVNSLPYPR